MLSYGNFLSFCILLINKTLGAELNYWRVFCTCVLQNFMKALMYFQTPTELFSGCFKGPIQCLYEKPVLTVIASVIFSVLHLHGPVLNNCYDMSAFAFYHYLPLHSHLPFKHMQRNCFCLPVQNQHPKTHFYSNSTPIQTCG